MPNAPADSRDAIGDVPVHGLAEERRRHPRADRHVSDPDPVTGEIDKLPPQANPDAGKPAGGVSQLDIENSLRFDNKLMAFDTTAAGPAQVLNWGAASRPANKGGFPQIGGVQLLVRSDLPAAAAARSWTSR